MVVPIWIRPVGDGTVKLLAGREPGKPTYVINNPATITKVYQYCALEEQHTQLSIELNCISDTLSSTHDKLDTYQHCMEGGQLPHLM